MTALIDSFIDFVFGLLLNITCFAAEVLEESVDTLCFTFNLSNFEPGKYFGMPKNRLTGVNLNIVSTDS